MPQPSKAEIQAAIAAFLKRTREPYVDTAQRMNVSVSTIRRIAAKFQIRRRKSVVQTVLDTFGADWAQDLLEEDEVAHE